MPKTLLFYRKECLKTTWPFRILALGVVVLGGWLTQGLWVPALGYSLTCEEQVGIVDAIILDNVGYDYLLFHRTTALLNDGLSQRVLVPTIAPPADNGDAVGEGFVRVMARVARLKTFETIRVDAIEPISLNVASQVREFLSTEDVTSVMLVTPGFRSKRSLLVYRNTLADASIDVACVPVFGTTSPDTWTDSWHGVQEVVLQFLKLHYYRLYVMPFVAAA